MSKDGVDDYLQTCIAMDTPIVLYPEMAKEIQLLICRTNCSGCLEDLAAKQEGLRELLSYCRAEENSGSGFGNACGLIAERLAPLLDGEK